MIATIAALAALAIASSLLIPQAYAQDWLFGPPRNVVNTNVTLFGNETIANQSQFEIRPEWQPPQSKSESESEIETNQITKIKIADLNKSMTGNHNKEACPDGEVFVIDACKDTEAVDDFDTEESCQADKYCKAYTEQKRAIDNDNNESEEDIVIQQGERLWTPEDGEIRPNSLDDLMKSDGNSECRNCDDIGEDLGEIMD